MQLPELSWILTSTSLTCIAVTFLVLLRQSETVAALFRRIRDPWQPAEPLSAASYASAKEQASEFVRSRRGTKIVLDQKANVSTICAAVPRSGAAPTQPSSQPQGRLNLDACVGVVAMDLGEGWVRAGGKTTFKVRERIRTVTYIKTLE